MHVLYRRIRPRLWFITTLTAGSLIFFQVVQRQPEELFNRLAFTLYAREWYEPAKTGMYDGTPVERAADFYIINRQCFGGKMEKGTWGIDYKCMRTYFDSKERLQEGHERLHNVYVEHMDFRKLIPKYDNPDALFYCDPPYIFNGTRGGKLYKNEMTDGDHAELSELLAGIKGKFILSGYANEVYDRAGFQRVSLGDVAMHIQCGQGVGKKTRKEEFI